MRRHTTTKRCCWEKTQGPIGSSSSTNDSSKLATKILGWKHSDCSLSNQQISYTFIKQHDSFWSTSSPKTYLHLSKGVWLPMLCIYFEKGQKQVSTQGYTLHISWLPPWSKGLQVYDLKSKKVFTSRDVFFHETCFSYSGQHHTSESPLPMPVFDDQLTNHDQPVVAISIPEPNQENVISKHLSQRHAEQNIQTRRSTRAHKPPSHLHDYICNNIQTSWCNMVSTPHQLICLSAMEEYPEPMSYEEAATHAGWTEAMQKEIMALQNNNTWDVVDLPKGKKVISCKWIYKTKLKADGSLERLKARLVIRGFHSTVWCRLSRSLLSSCENGHY